MPIYNESLSQYIKDNFAREDEKLRQTQSTMRSKGLPAISISSEEGRFLQVLVRSAATRHALEIGSLAGYSGLWIARGLVPGGKLITIERDPLRAEITRATLAKAGVAEMVDVRYGDAHEVIRKFEPERLFDFVFIDAEKAGYIDYFDWALAHVRMNGVIAAHNAFRGGSILNQESEDDAIRNIRDFNAHVAAESKVISTIIPIGDGTLVATRVF
jgi:caffeoyl-CoA O-methyltransferase